MKRIARRNTAVTNTVILVFDLCMLFVSAALYQKGAVGFDGVLIPTIALFSSFEPAVALENLGSYPAEYLCGGERQRLGLARAFLHDASFLLLDEPTSNLDSLNEAVILKSLREGQDGKAVVLVSHWQSTMRIADEIYSVENGRMS